MKKIMYNLGSASVIMLAALTIMPSGSLAEENVNYEQEAFSWSNFETINDETQANVTISNNIFDLTASEKIDFGEIRLHKNEVNSAEANDKLTVTVNSDFYEANGWKLSAKLGEFKATQSNTTLKGATITLKNASIAGVGSSGQQVKNNVVLTAGSLFASDVITEKKGYTNGQTVYTALPELQVNNKGRNDNSQAIGKQFTANITWTLKNIRDYN